jgi:uncharacterized membrane protein YphA (DoxX/SURF4 family)
MMFRKIVSTDNASTTMLIRLMVGAIFLSEGIQKFRFEDPFVGSFEIICGALALVGFLTRLASIPLITIMLVAIATTKAEVLVNEGFWEMMHGSRTDWSMLLGGIFLLIKGGGRWSVDKTFDDK